MTNLNGMILDIKRQINDLNASFEDLRLSIIRDELNDKREFNDKGIPLTIEEQEIFDSWYRFYTEDIHLLHHTARMRAARRVAINRKHKGE